MRRGVTILTTGRFVVAISKSLILKGFAILTIVTIYKQDSTRETRSGIFGRRWAWFRS